MKIELELTEKEFEALNDILEEFRASCIEGCDIEPSNNAKKQLIKLAKAWKRNGFTAWFNPQKKLI